MEPQPEIERHIIENGDGFPIGIIDLFQIDRIAGSAGIGIFIADKRHRRLGHASQALTLLIDELCKRRWLFLRALIHLENQASIRLFESAGFSPGAEVLYRGLPARQYVLHLKHNIS